MTCAVISAAPQEKPLTKAEASEYAATSRYSDVIQFIEALQQQSLKLRVETLGISAEGRKIPLLIIGSPVPATPLEMLYDGRLVVYIQAGIHAGEVEGKEAALMLARDLALAEDPVLSRQHRSSDRSHL